MRRIGILSDTHGYWMIGMRPISQNATKYGMLATSVR